MQAGNLEIVDPEAFLGARCEVFEGPAESHEGLIFEGKKSGQVDAPGMEGIVGGDVQVNAGDRNRACAVIVGKGAESRRCGAATLVGRPDVQADRQMMQLESGKGEVQTIAHAPGIPGQTMSRQSGIPAAPPGCAFKINKRTRAPCRRELTAEAT